MLFVYPAIFHKKTPIGLNFPTCNAAILMALVSMRPMAAAQEGSFWLSPDSVGTGENHCNTWRHFTVSPR